MIRRVLAFTIAIIMLAAVSGCGGNKENEQAAAMVNGVAIKTADFEKTLDVLKTELEQKGVDLNSEEGNDQMNDLEDQAIDQLVTKEVLVQQADKENYTVSDEEVNEEIDKIKEQYGEQFNEVLEMNQLTLEDLERLTRENKLITAYIDGVVGEITVTEEEMKKWYDDYSEQTEEEVPEYDDVKEQIESNIKSQKEYEKTNDLIEELKENSEIEILI